ncbi:helix-turn-helix domain-containing protein [Nocardioides terrisoli]|uniref:helix-turn-helix domain-containing protein n=1 Tax=Nocardioides terrisoli TaxID=3388267 RepID=UPI00287BC6C1|nr:helix-turn-helix domain-containing protein [Nocardioides marmorisolisilvae]
MSATLSSLIPEANDADLARVALDHMRATLEVGKGHGPHDPVRLTVPDSEDEIVVPRSVLDLLSQVLAHMANGQGVTLVPANAELTTQQAADMLNVSRPFLIRLLETGEIEHRLVGTHRRVLADSLVRYMRLDDAKRAKVADELAALTHDLGVA